MGDGTEPTGGVRWEDDREQWELWLRSRRRRCSDCGIYWADYPSDLCPGCEAYREHQR